MGEEYGFEFSILYVESQPRLWKMGFEKDIKNGFMIATEGGRK